MGVYTREQDIVRENEAVQERGGKREIEVERERT